MCAHLIELMRDEDGATMVEYALMAGFIAAVCVGIVESIGLSTRDLYASCADKL